MTAVQRTALDGVTVLWLPSVEEVSPVTGGIMFRCGQADEPLPKHGICHLIEHLALHKLGRPTYTFNGNVNDNLTSFYATGETSEIAQFLNDLCAAVHNLPFERLEDEQRILRTESDRPNSVIPHLFRHRFGPQGYGLLNCFEFAIDNARDIDLATWASEWFTKENAVVWMTCKPPHDLKLPLPRGVRKPPPPPQPIPELECPAYLHEGGGVVAISGLLTPSPAQSAFLWAIDRRLEERLRHEDALSYSINASGWRLDLDTHHVTVSADCLDSNAELVRDQMLSVLEDIALSGLVEDELQRLKEETAQASTREPCEILERAVLDEFLEDYNHTDAEWRQLVGAVDSSAVAEVARQMINTALVLLPDGTPIPADSRMQHLATARMTDTIVGEKVRVSGLRRLFDKSELTVGVEGISWRDDEDPGGTLLFDRCVMAIRKPRGVLGLWGDDDVYFEINPSDWKNGEAIVAEVAAALDPSILMSDPALAQSERVEEVAEAIGSKWLVQEELNHLENVLDPREELVTLGKAMRSWEYGVLAVTDRRTVFLVEGHELRVDEFRHRDLEEVTVKGDNLTARWGGDELKWEIEPKGRTEVLAQAIRKGKRHHWRTESVYF